VSAPDDTLLALAAARGVATEYWSWLGEHVVVGADTIRSVLAALGVDASTPAAAEAALADDGIRAWRRTLPPTVVCREGWTPWVSVHVPHGTGVKLTVETEDGASRPVRQVDHLVEPRMVDGVLTGEATFELDGDLPLGWHLLHADVEAGTRTTSTLIVTPQRLVLPAALAGAPGHRHGGRVWGLMHQVYALRSEESWGMGDLADLAELAAWGGDRLGAGFVLVNPLHAAQPVSPIEASPYRPSTRRFASPLYLRPEDIPEVAALEAERLREVEVLAAKARDLNAQDTIDRDAVWAAKEPALRLIHTAGRSRRRQAAFDRFKQREGSGLLDFATWCALAEVNGLPWQDWPEPLRDPRSEAVSQFAQGHADQVDFHCWLQWQLRDQLAMAQHEALSAGMSIGVVHDLAVGVHPDGADTWALGSALARSVSVGAPPDQFNQLGQDWHQPPWRPDALAELGYGPYRDMLRTLLRDSGGVRVDHVMGLFRLWWVPTGHLPTEGTYVYYDPEAMIGVLALEAHRAGAVVVGEDLGVVEPRVRDYLRDRGMLGTSILWFEHDEAGPLAPEEYRDLCLATVTTHDLPPTAGFLQLEHVAIRERLGLLTRTVAEEQAAERQAIDAVLAMLRGRGLLPDSEEAGAADTQQIVEALHAFLLLTPSRLLGVAVPDLVGDRRAVNQPGTETEYPNWRVPVTGAVGQPLTLTDVMQSTRALSLAAVLQGHVSAGR
jgi:4-alpha-glucanotransferase